MIERKVKTKDIIIEVARDLFMDKGFQGTSTREIAQRANITQPNLYHHFSTKESIYIAVLEQLSSEVKAAVESIIDTDHNNLFDTLLHIFDYLRESHPVNFLLMSHDMSHKISPENHTHLYQVWQSSYVLPLVELFEQHLTDESSFNARELAQYFYAIISPFIQRDEEAAKQVNSEKVTRLFVYGMLAS